MTCMQYIKYYLELISQTTNRNAKIQEFAVLETHLLENSEDVQDDFRFRIFQHSGEVGQVRVCCEDFLVIEKAVFKK